MEKNLENNPEYQEGIRIGNDIIKFMNAGFYKSLDDAIESKEYLQKDFLKELGWDDTHPQVLKNKGTLDSLYKAKKELEKEHNNYAAISLGDIDNVAKSINKSITLEQAEEIIKKYPSAQDNDPNATWDLVVEQLIYEL